MIEAIAIAAGVAIGARVLRCIFDELSDEEYQKQERIRQDREALQKDYEKYESGVKFWKERRINQISSAENEQTAALQREYGLKMLAEWNSYCHTLIDEANQYLADRESLYDEIKSTIKSVKTTLQDQSSMLRRNSLLGLLRELEEAKEKVYAYKIYLRKYIKAIERRIDHLGDLPDQFSFTLPAEFPYRGKLFYVKKQDLLIHREFVIPVVGSQNYIFEEQDFIEDFDDDAMIPLMCDSFVAAPQYAYRFSARKGHFKNIVTNTPKVGITATVTRYGERRNIILRYNDCMDLYLPKTNLANEKRYPPIGARLRVFPTKWDYNLGRPVEVSERTSDSYLSYSFDDVPVVFSEAQWEEFKKVLEEKSLLESTGDWKIAPLNEKTISKIEEVKLQLNSDLCFAAKIIVADNKLYFSYNGILSEEYYVRPDDVFLGIDCTLNICLDKEIAYIDESVYDNMTSLTLMCLSEFRSQFQTKSSRKGMQYFNKWAETTDKLITYLYKGKSTEVGIADIQEEPRKKGTVCDYSIIVSDPDSLKEFVDVIYANAKNARKVEFFFELSDGIYCFTSIKGDGGVLYTSGEASLLGSYLKNREIITLYHRSTPYAEMQQAAALHQFRVGRLANSALQAYALDSNNIQSVPSGCAELSLFNGVIARNPSQLDAVERAIREKEIFYIQGPPGTGKTTVIREIILQALQGNPLAKILVVSQANAAVDNVLKGLLNKIGVDVRFVRCGHADKIDPAIVPYSFEQIYETYTDRISKKLEDDPQNMLLRKWGEIVFSEGKYNPNVGELILKGQPIIGATCVGLAKKQIGLDRVEFDLVIIDEAGKALPAEILIPYVRGKKVIMIGDHMQLPPTVHPALLDPEKIDIEDRDLYEDELFNTSFFERQYDAAPESNKCMLSTQYRMPTAIGSLISSLFYNGRLKNGEGTEKKRPLYFAQCITLVNTTGKKYIEQSPPGKSVTNAAEAELVAALLLKIRETIAPELARIAVITPYKGQKRLILQEISRGKAAEKLHRIDINTVDAFQGDEAEIVIFCCTRTKTPTNFFKDPRRINVAFSRAKNELIILGSLDYFMRCGKDSVLPRIAAEIRKYGTIISDTDAIHYSSTEPQSDEKLSFHATKAKPVRIPLSAIIIPDDFMKTPPKKVKVEKVEEYYTKYGKLDKPIVVVWRKGNYELRDKYLRYYVAKKLGLEEIDAYVRDS